MKLAMAQTVVSTDISTNGAAIRAMITKAAAQGARLVCFCEGALSGYSKFQMESPAEWPHFDWAAQEAELRAIAVLCGDLRIFAAVGGAHRLPAGHPPHHSLYILSDSGSLLTRYDKRFLSNSELGGWYTPGTMPIIVEIDGFRFGCAICIESQFPEVFSDYQRMGVDGVFLSSYGLPSYFQVALRAHAELNCLWIGAATPAQKAGKGPSGIIGPDGEWMVRCAKRRSRIWPWLCWTGTTQPMISRFRRPGLGGRRHGKGTSTARSWSMIPAVTTEMNIDANARRSRSTRQSSSRRIDGQDKGMDEGRLLRHRRSMICPLVYVVSFTCREFR